MNIKAKGYFRFKSFGNDLEIDGVGFFKEANLVYGLNDYVFLVDENNIEKLEKEIETGKGYLFSLKIFMKYINENNKIFIEIEEVINNVELSERGFGKLEFNDVVARYLDGEYISITKSDVYSTDSDFNKKRLGINLNAKWDKTKLNAIKDSKIFSIERTMMSTTEIDQSNDSLKAERSKNIFSSMKVSIAKNPDFNYVFLHNSSK